MLISPVIGHPQSVFQKTFGGDSDDVGLSVRQTNDNGYIITGYSMSYDPPGIYLIKTDSAGNENWSKTYGYSYVVCVVLTDDNGYIMAGRRGGHCIIKTNGMGDTLWSKGFGFPGSMTWGRWIQQTTDGGYITIGQRFFINAGIDMYAVKTDSMGDTIWMKTYYNFNTGNAGIDFDFRVHQTQDVGFIISSIAGQLFLLKIDSAGQWLWLKRYSGNSGTYSSSMSITNDKGYILVSSSNILGAGGSDVYIIRTDSAGNVMWAKTYGGAGDDYGESVQQTYDGGYIIEGYTNSFGFGGNDVYLIKIDSSGNVEWSNTYGGSGDDYGYSVQQTTDSGYVTVGKTNSFGAGYDDVYLIKTDVNGNEGGCNITAVNTTVTNVSPTVTIDSVVIESGVGGAYNIQTEVNNIAISPCNACNPLIITTDSIKNAVCYGDTTGVSYITVSGGIPPYSYIWSNGDTTEDITGLPAGVYTITVTDSNNCSAKDTSITITEPPALLIGIGADTSICQGDSITLNAVAGFISYLWQDSSTNQMLTVSSQGYYFVEVTDTSGCFGADTTYITVYLNPVVSLGNDTSFCQGNTLVLNAGNTSTGFLWQDSSINQTFTVNATGQYYVTATDNNGCKGSDTTEITVNPLPTINLGPDTTLCNTCTITLDAGAGFAGYNWSTGENTQTIIVDSAGAYTVQVTDTNGCAGADTIVIDIASGISISSIINNQLNIYPNPGRGVFTIECRMSDVKCQMLEVKVFDVLGRTVFKSKDIRVGFEIDISDYTEGLYYVQVITDENVIIRKVIYQ